MATGGDFGYEDLDLDNQLDNDDDDDDEKEVNRTQPFQPDAASTPYHRGEQLEMQTMQHEKSGLPSYEGTPGAQAEQQISWDHLTRVFPEASATNLETSYSKTGRLQVKMMGFGKKIYELFTREKGTGKQHLNPSLSKEIKKSLGPMAEEIIAEDRDTIQEETQRLKETENQLKQTEDLVAKKEQLIQEKEELTRKINILQARLDAIHDEHGSEIQIETETRRLEQLIKNYKTRVKELDKEIASILKKIKIKEEMEAKEKREIARIQKKESEKNAMQERLNSTKQTEDLKEQVRELQRQNAEDQAIIQDENASPSYKQAAEDREAERNEEIARLLTTVEERERERPLQERVKEIFKKYGVTVASVLLAAGVTIGVVVSTVTNALKASTKALGKGLKDIGAKLGSLLPGLIGSVANFLFKAAGQAIGFLAEHTWLLILAVVAFLFEKNLKNRR